jgi:C4-dicarboxylate transporter
MMNINMLTKLSVRSVVVIILVIGAFVLAIADHNFRPTFGDLAKVGVGGYLGQMLPEAKRTGDSQ